MIVVHPHITEADVLAVRATADGTASPGQAKQAFDWVMREACRFMTSPAMELPKEATHDDLMLAEGRRMVGSMIRTMFLDATLDAATLAAQSTRGKTK